MVETYDSVEQSERVKKWLAENGSGIVMGLVIAFGGLFGFKQWQNWDAAKQARASAEYQVLVEQLDEGNLDGAVGNFETLREDYASSPYAALAALRMAKARIESEQADLAVGLYRYAIEHGEPPPVRTIAKSRLARLQLDLGDPAAARQTLATIGDTSGFESQLAEIRGDILLAEGDPEAAIAAYRDALAQLDTGIGNPVFLRLKLQALGADPDETAGNES